MRGRGDYSFIDGRVDHASDIFEVRTNAGAVTIVDFERGIDKLDLTAFGVDQNGVSAYWTGSAAQSGFNTLLTLTGKTAKSSASVCKAWLTATCARPAI